ncbi:uncharacterized protein YtpQ (UPF0354 family) [Caldalkalibacillus uzonensis]|uniref:Uncharacterized protein YtpQ (UPF0354 family) n=1 Tax=Caldalkalibacillus uzonensis TaxID=353224 RepID=A0ABU0CRF0_9BACI|nr:DUF1444 family protein [Caldalkalibacillus uzonensis]MDQ0338998.1 uncharacterized protein YtpQ (UPF0354 family) [Caldalkalibacillus uzonensis]
MNSQEIRQALEKESQKRGWQTRWDRDKEKLEVRFDEAHAPFEVSIPRVVSRIRQEKADPQQVLNDMIRQIQIVVEAAKQRETLSLTGKDEYVYPVMRSTSFPVETSDGKALVYAEHTAESRIFYALDLGQSYTLIDTGLLEEAGWSQQELKEKALFNLRGLTQEAKLDVVAGNHFYFISPGDGYGASRILNHSLLQMYAQKAKGEFCLAIPHQDVLVMADIRNDDGYDILQQLTLAFYRQGDMPITMLPFQYKDGQMEPIFILAKRKPVNGKRKK